MATAADPDPTRSFAISIDAELVRRAVAGERDAFGAIYRRYHTVVYRFARAMSGSSVVAEDVTQEAFITLMRHLTKYDPERANLASYLYGVARNLTRARLRREQRFVRLDLELEDAREQPGPDDPSSIYARSQELTRLRRAILALPSRYREVVILCDLHALSYAEAAAALRCPVGTVRSRLHRGRNLLAERLQGRAREGTATLSNNVARCLA